MNAPHTHSSGLPPDIRSRYSFGGLVQRYVGLVDSVSMLPLEIGAAEIEVAAATLGDVSMAMPFAPPGSGRGGAGADADAELAWVRAVVEAAERYACMVHDERDLIVASASELGSSAVDLHDIPRCSQAELSDPQCPIHLPPLQAPIRWVRGYSLVDERERLVPAVMAHFYLSLWDSERFWLPISTGVAAHSSLHSALVAAICENIERDAIALTWLGRVGLPSLTAFEPAKVGEDSILRRVRRSGVRFFDFDATTDLGIPTVFSVQTSPAHPYCSISVSCATELDPEQARIKAWREACAARVMLNKSHETPSRVIDFNKLTHGASYYGRGGHESDFDFLLADTRPVTTIAAPNGRASGVGLSDDEKKLAFLVTRLRELAFDAIAIDLTTDEVRDAGLWVVRVIIPKLMPITFFQRARYLGTPRLYDYVSRVRNCPFTESKVNAGPLPFA